MDVFKKIYSAKAKRSNRSPFDALVTKQTNKLIGLLSRHFALPVFDIIAKCRLDEMETVDAR